MTNEQKAKEIAENQFSWYSDFDDVNSFEECYESAMEMAKWKDEQHKQEKQQWIDEACEWWKNEFTYPTMTQTEIDYIQEKIENFKNAMKGE